MLSRQHSTHQYNSNNHRAFNHKVLEWCDHIHISASMLQFFDFMILSLIWVLFIFVWYCEEKFFFVISMIQLSTNSSILGQHRYMNSKFLGFHLHYKNLINVVLLNFMTMTTLLWAQNAKEVMYLDLHKSHLPPIKYVNG